MRTTGQRASGSAAPRTVAQMGKARTGTLAGVAVAVAGRVPDVIATSNAIAAASTVHVTRPASTTTLAEQIAALEARRVELSCSRAALARLVGVSPATIARALAPQRLATVSRVKLHSADGLRRLEIALALYARERASGRRGAPGATRSTTAAKTSASRAQRPISNGDVIAPRSRTQSRTVKIARWLETEQPVDLPETTPTKGSAAMRQPPSFRILVAEDDPATIALYQMVLAEEEDVRYTVEFVQTPQDCLERLLRARSSKPYDLLLTDLGLADIRPDDQRPSLLQHFTQYPELLPRATLVVSGISPYALQRKRAQLATLHAAFLPKPFDIDELLAVVRALCLVEVLPAACVSFDEVAWQ